MNGVWHHYDGLLERNSRGQGLQKCTGKPSTPSGSSSLTDCTSLKRFCFKKWPISFDPVVSVE